MTTETLAQTLARYTREGELYEKLPDKALRCFACGHRCLIREGKRGVCMVRFNEGGVLKVPFGYVGALQCDPVEKKPFFHVLPGTNALSFGMLGCDFHCSYCLAGSTTILTDHGPKTLERLWQETAERLQRNDGEVGFPQNLKTVTAEGRWRLVHKIFRHSYKGSLVRLRPRHLAAIECTPDHRFLATTHASVAPIWLRAEELTTEHFLVVPKPREVFTEVAQLDVAALLDGTTATYKIWRKTSDAIVEQITQSSAQGVTSRALGQAFSVDPSYIRHVRSKVRRGLWRRSHEQGCQVEGDQVRFFKEHGDGIPRRLPLDERLAELFGYYCAEGCVHALKNRPNSLTMSLSFAPEEESLRLRVSALFEQVFGVRTSTVNHPTTVAVEARKASLGRLFQNVCGARAIQKRAPHQLVTAPHAVVQAFLNAYIAGDGHRYPNGKVSVTTVSRELAFGISWLVLRIGYLPAVYVNEVSPTRIVEGRRVNQAGTQYTIVWYEKPLSRRGIVETAQHYHIPIRSIERRSFSGYVYNLEVEEDHSYLAHFAAVKNCQNWVTSQSLRDPAAGTPPQLTRPEQLVATAKELGAAMVASTYNEPLITSEWAVAVFKVAKAQGFKTAYISNGNGTEEVLQYIRPWLDCYKIDLKSFNPQHYRLELGGQLETVKWTVRRVHELGLWLEIVTLIIPGFNDSPDELRQIADFLVNISPDIPWHVTAFHQDYKMTDPANTSPEVLIRAAEIGIAAGLRYVYAGNLPGLVGGYEHTYCPSCKTPVIEREGYTILANRLIAGRCPRCRTAIPGRWS